MLLIKCLGKFPNPTRGSKRAREKIEQLDELGYLSPKPPSGIIHATEPRKEGIVRIPGLKILFCFWKILALFFLLSRLINDTSALMKIDRESWGAHLFIGRLENPIIRYFEQ